MANVVLELDTKRYGKVTIIAKTENDTPVDADGLLEITKSYLDRPSHKQMKVVTEFLDMDVKEYYRVFEPDTVHESEMEVEVEVEDPDDESEYEYYIAPHHDVVEMSPDDFSEWIDSFTGENCVDCAQTAEGDDNYPFDEAIDTVAPFVDDNYPPDDEIDQLLTEPPVEAAMARTGEVRALRLLDHKGTIWEFYEVESDFNGDNLKVHPDQNLVYITKTDDPMVKQRLILEAKLEIIGMDVDQVDFTPQRICDMLFDMASIYK